MKIDNVPSSELISWISNTDVQMDGMTVLVKGNSIYPHLAHYINNKAVERSLASLSLKLKYVRRCPSLIDECCCAANLIIMH